MSLKTLVEKIDVQSNTRKILKEPVALEAPVNIYVNDEYVITLLATPEFKRELAVGWLFDEGLLHSLDEVKKIFVEQDSVNVTTKHPVKKERLKGVGVSRLFTTSCGLSTDKFFRIISESRWQFIESEYTVKADNIFVMVQKLNEGKLFQSTGGVHVAALFEEERLIAFAEDIGRHNTIDKVVGKGILSKVNFTNSVLVSSGRQPADMVLKAARMGIPIVVSRAAPIRSGIIAADKTGITLACFVRNNKMNIYTYPHRIVTN